MDGILSPCIGFPAGVSSQKEAGVHVSFTWGFGIGIDKLLVSESPSMPQVSFRETETATLILEN